jgi:hypothetical protein
MTIKSSKLNELRDYFLNGGSTDPDDVKAQLDTEDDDVMEAYVARLKTKWPEDFGGDIPEPELVYQLKDDNNILRDLEVVRQKDNRIILKVKEPTEIVNVLVKGEVVSVDLVQLRKFPTAETYGVSNVRLLELAELAK